MGTARVLVIGALLFGGCGADDTAMVDAGPPDAGPADAGSRDAGVDGGVSDPCAEGRSECAPLATCTPTGPDGYECTCPEGTDDPVGDGRRCVTWAALAVSDEDGLSAGHACALRGGQVVCWGDNRWHQSSTAAVPTVPSPAFMDARDDYTFVAVADGLTCAIAGGELWCGGRNVARASGSSWGDAPGEPWQRIGSRSDWAQVALAPSRACGITLGGSLYCWGASEDMAAPEAPELKTEATGWTSIDLTDRFACGTRDGGIYCWGELEGSPLQLTETDTPTAPTGITNEGFTDVVVDTAMACALREGELWCWGLGAEGLTGAAPPVTRPTRVGDADDWIALSEGGTDCAIRSNGDLYCWKNARLPGVDGSDTPTLVSSRWSQIASAGGFDGLVCGVRDHVLRCSGPNGTNQIGDGVPAHVEAATLADDQSWTSLEAKRATRCGTTSDGDILCWGELHGSDPQLIPSGGVVWDAVVAVPSLQMRALQGSVLRTIVDGAVTDVPGIDAVTVHDDRCVIDGGTIQCEGTNVFDPLASWSEMTAIVEGTDWTDVAASEHHICGIRSGALHCGGQGLHGALGDGDASFHRTDALIPVGAETDWADVATGWTATCAIRSGELYCTGRLRRDGTAAVTLTRIGTANDWSAIDGAGDGDEATFCGVRADGIYCWGAHPLGPPLAGLEVPQRFAEGVGWTDLSVDRFAFGPSVCALLDGRRHCWGTDYVGQLGTGRALFVDELRPVSAPE